MNYFLQHTKGRYLNNMNYYIIFDKCYIIHTFSNMIYFIKKTEAIIEASVFKHYH